MSRDSLRLMGGAFVRTITLLAKTPRVAGGDRKPEKSGGVAGSGGRSDLGTWASVATVFALSFVPWAGIAFSCVGL